MIVYIISIGSQQTPSTERTLVAITQSLDYVHMYPNDGITYRPRSMVLGGNSDAPFLNESKARSRSGVHIFLSEDVPIPDNTVPILTLSQIIKSVMSSVEKLELAGHFINAKQIPLPCQTLIEMG